MREYFVWIERKWSVCGLVGGAQHCLWDPADKDCKNERVHDMAVAFVAEGFGCGWAIGEC